MSKQSKEMEKKKNSPNIIELHRLKLVNVIDVLNILQKGFMYALDKGFVALDNSHSTQAAGVECMSLHLPRRHHPP